MRYDGRPGVISYDTEAAEQTEPRRYEHERRILATFGSPTIHDGMPTERESGRLHAFEDALVRALDAAGVDGWLVGRLTTDGARVFVFQVQMPQAFDEVAVRVVRDFGDLKPRVAKAVGWQFFDDNLRPTFADEVQMACARVIEGLKKAGSDVSRPHMLDHTFVGTEAQLASLRRDLEKRGYAVQPSEQGSLVASKASSLNVFQVTEVACDLHELAESTGADYAGWGAAVVSARS